MISLDVLHFRLINYIRLEKPSPGFVMSLSSSQKWADPAFLRPQIPDDPLLMFDFDEELAAEAGGEDEEENGFEIDISRELNDQIAKNPVSAGGRLSPGVVEAENVSSSHLSSDLLSSLNKMSLLFQAIQGRDGTLEMVKLCNPWHGIVLFMYMVYVLNPIIRSSKNIS